MRTIALLLLIIVTGCEVRQAQPDRAGAAVLLTQATLDASDKPAPTPDNGECSNCNGKGWVGDGVTMFPCSECNADEHIPRPGSIGAMIDAVVPVSDPPVWYDNLPDALINHHDNGGLLAVIVGGDNCEPCELRYKEAKALKSSAYNWVYCKTSDPALAWMDLDADDFTKVPVFIKVVGNTVTPYVKPEELGLKEKL